MRHKISLFTPSLFYKKIHFFNSSLLSWALLGKSLALLGHFLGLLAGSFILALFGNYFGTLSGRIWGCLVGLVTT